MKKIKIEGQSAPVGSNRRALELYVDARFKPRVIRSKRVYSRKRVNKWDQ